MPIRPFQKFREQQEAAFGGTCDGVLYDVDISIALSNYNLGGFVSEVIQVVTWQ